MILATVVLALLAAAPAPQAGACKFADQPTAAVLDVKTSGLPPDMANLLSNALRSNLVETRCFKVQDQAQMKEILATQMINQSEMCDEECAVESGRLLQVRYLASAQVYVAGTGAAALGRLTDVESGTAVASALISLPSTELGILLDGMRRVAEKISGVALAPPDAALAARAAGGSGPGKIEVAVVPAGAEVFLDGHKAGAAPVTITAGGGILHIVRAEAAGYDPMEQQVMVEADGVRKLDMALTRDYSRAWWMVGGGLGLAAAGAAVVLWALSGDKFTYREENGARIFSAVSEEDAVAYDRWKTVGLVAGGAGAALLGTGLVIRVAF